MVEIMSELTAQQLKNKIEQVKKDIETVKQSSEPGHKIDVMCQYVEYLEDELRNVENKR